MDRNRVTVRYAKAFVELAHEQGLIKDAYHDIRMLYTALSDFAGFNDFIINPGTAYNQKLLQIKEIFSGEFHPLTLRFLELIFTKNRGDYLKDVCRNCIDMIRKKQGIISASLVTAQPLASTISDQIKGRFEKRLNTTIEMEASVHHELIGGFIFTIDGQQYDASIASKLLKIRKQLQIK